MRNTINNSVWSTSSMFTGCPDCLLNSTKFYVSNSYTWMNLRIHTPTQTPMARQLLIVCSIINTNTVSNSSESRCHCLHHACVLTLGISPIEAIAFFLSVYFLLCSARLYSRKLLKRCDVLPVRRQYRWAMWSFRVCLRT